jgi:hypothetical protein
MVTISTPNPRPETNRQKLIPTEVVWQAMMILAAVYHSSE